MLAGEVPGHLQSTAEVPLRMLLNPQMLRQGPAASRPGVYPYAAGIGSRTLPTTPAREKHLEDGWMDG